MPHLTWNELDFLECLEVIPEVEEDYFSYGYTVRKGGLVLQVTVWQFYSSVQFSLFREGADTAITSFSCFVRGPIRHVDDQRGDYLEMNDCVLAPSPFQSIKAGDPFDRRRFPVGMLIALAIKPDLRISID